MDKDGPISPGEPKSLKDLAKVFGMFIKDIIQKWSATQSFTPRQQLEAGIRYFDIRISTKPGHDDLYIVHGLYGLTVSSVLAEIKEFLDEHPKEVIMIDFNHFYDMTPEMHLSCMELIESTFAEKLCPFLDTESLCLETLWESNLQVIAFYQNPLAEENMVFWPASSITSPWPNVTEVDEMLSRLEIDYEQGRPRDKFYVTQGILTPDVSFILSHIGGSIEKTLAEKVAKSVAFWLEKMHCGLKKGINICIIDFVQCAEFIPIVVNLNLKSTDVMYQ